MDVICDGAEVVACCDLPKAVAEAPVQNSTNAGIKDVL